MLISSSFSRTQTSTSRFSWVLFFVWFFSTSVYSSPQNQVDGFKVNLASDPVWLRLLHQWKNGAQASQSEVISKEFFLSENGQFDPTAELQAALQALDRRQTTDLNQHPVCRFPARYAWLAQNIEGVGERVNKFQCPRLSLWRRSYQDAEVSLMMVSSYFGNPASTFGHALLTVGSGDASFNKLLDTGVNFGANVPSGESMPLYIAKGIFGGYSAGFTEKKFYAHDMTYLRGEQRDMWAYRLNLGADKKRLLLDHLWELTGAKFQYYFLDKNCAYRLAELVSLGLRDPLIDGFTFAYRPADLFHKLSKLNEQNGNELIRKIDFLPSNKRIVYAAYNALTKRQAGWVKQYLQSEDRLGAPDFATSSDNDKIATLDFLIRYLNFQLETDIDSESRRAFERRRLFLMRSRLNLPAISSPLPFVKAQTPPTEGPPPRLNKLGFLTDSSVGMDAWYLDLAPYSYDELSSGVELGSAFSVLRARVSLSDSKIGLSELELLKLLSIRPAEVDLPQERVWAWGVSLGWREVSRFSQQLHGYFSGRFGVSHSLPGGHIAAYMLGATVSEPIRQSEVSAELQFLGGSESYGRYQATLKARFDKQKRDSYSFNFQWRYALSSNLEIGASVFSDMLNGNTNAISQFELLHYW